MNTVVPVKIKWNKLQFDNVDFDLSGDVMQFKTQLYSLTGAAVLVDFDAIVRTQRDFVQEYPLNARS